MSVSASPDDSAGNPEAEPIKPKRILRPLSEDQWRLARIQFETSDKLITHRIIADRFNTSLSAVQKRSQAEQWSKGQAIVDSVRSQAAIAMQEAAAIEARKAGALAGKQLAEELQPWIEREKRSHILRAIKRSKRAFKRLDRVADGYQVYDAKRGTLVDCETTPKDEMSIAAAEDKYDGIIRRNLGMGDSDSGPAGSLSLRILTEGAAIEATIG